MEVPEGVELGRLSSDSVWVTVCWIVLINGFPLSVASISASTSEDGLKSVNVEPSEFLVLEPSVSLEISPAQVTFRE
jgi:hypothetical protein